MRCYDKHYNVLSTIFHNMHVAYIYITSAQLSKEYIRIASPCVPLHKVMLLSSGNCAWYCLSMAELDLSQWEKTLHHRPFGNPQASFIVT